MQRHGTELEVLDVDVRYHFDPLEVRDAASGAHLGRSRASIAVRSRQSLQTSK